MTIDQSLAIVEALTDRGWSGWRGHSAVTAITRSSVVTPT